jgi:hypothetical protein
VDIYSQRILAFKISDVTVADLAGPGNHCCS